MKNIFFSLIVISCQLTFAQIDPPLLKEYPSNIFFGIDLDKDWYTLTEQSGLSYTLFKNQNPDSQFVTVNLHKSIYNLINPDLLKIGLDLKLGFEIKQVSDFNNLFPIHLFGSVKFKSLSEYRLKGIDKFSNLFSLLVKKFGFPTQMTVASDPGIDSAAFVWERENFLILINLNAANNKSIQLIYSKK